MQAAPHEPFGDYPAAKPSKLRLLFLLLLPPLLLLQALHQRHDIPQGFLLSCFTRRKLLNDSKTLLFSSMCVLKLVCVCVCFAGCASLSAASPSFGSSVTAFGAVYV